MKPYKEIPENVLNAGSTPRVGKWNDLGNLIEL